MKRDDLRNHELAKELVARLNLEGGSVLLGVEDDGSVGSTSREASREGLERLFQSSGQLHYGLKPVPGADIDALDRRRLHDYLTGVLGGPVPPDDVTSEWETLLRNIDLMVVSAGQTVATIDGLLLFGMTPNRYLPQAGIRAICYPGSEPDYATRADEDLRGPLVALDAGGGALGRPAPRRFETTPRRGVPSALLDRGLVEQAWDFVRRNTTPTARLDDGRRTDGWEYPESVLREAVVNALVHRDYSIAGADIMLAIFADRIEIQSPGRLPNTVTPEGMRAGVRYARNQTLVNVMRDYGYVDARGMGVRNKIIPDMQAHNGTEPDLIAEDHRFTVRLWKETPGRAP